MTAPGLGIIAAVGSTATISTPVVISPGPRLNLIVVIASGAGSVTVTITGVSPQFTYPILISTALSGAGTYVMRVGPELTPSANAVADDNLPGTVQVTTAVSGTISYGIDYVSSQASPG